MIKIGFLKVKLPQLAFLCFVAYCLSNFVPSLIPGVNFKGDGRIYVNSQRIDGAKYIEG